MKKCLFLPIIGLLLISWNSIAQTRTVELPEYEGCNLGFLEITKLELKESETVLYFDAFETTEPISLSSKIVLKGKFGKIYNFIRSEGIEMDKQILIPASGTISFKLHMQPMDKKETSFDFIEGKTYKELRIQGIKTHKIKSTALIHCVIKGEVIDRPGISRLKLKKTFENNSLGKYITTYNGKFEYTLDFQYMESYSLRFDEEYKGVSWWPIIFFPESGSVTIKLFPYDRLSEDVVTVKEISRSSSKIKSSKQSGKLIEARSLNQEWVRYHTLKDSLFNKDSLYKIDKILREENHFYSEVANKPMKQYSTTDDENVKDSLKTILSKLQEKGELLTPEAMSLMKQIEKKEEQSQNWTMKYIKENTTIVGYSILLNTTTFALQNSSNYISECIDLYISIYANKYPNHPYTKVMNNMTSIMVGRHYIDFISPDFNGKPIKLSDQIKGKVALIDLWASWCGPCREKAKKMIPVYETYKEKGFTVIGVAREDSLKSGINAAQKDKYPWLNLIELNDVGRIWEKYGVGNAGGATYLVDKNGVVLAISPTEDEVKVILDKLLK